MTLGEFGTRLWGTGVEGAVASLNAITRESLDELKLSLELAKRWRDFYATAVERKRGDETAERRKELLDKCLKLLGENGPEE